MCIDSRPFCWQAFTASPADFFCREAASGAEQGDARIQAALRGVAAGPTPRHRLRRDGLLKILSSRRSTRQRHRSRVVRGEGVKADGERVHALLRPADEPDAALPCVPPCLRRSLPAPGPCCHFL